METSEIADDISTLNDQITTLTSALSPLLSQPLTTTTSTLPLLDKAKLYILATYTLESLLFSSLKLSAASGTGGVEDVKNHAVFTELKRVREYFGKIEAAEGAGKGPGVRIDKGAVGRLVKNGVFNSEDRDRERAKGREVKVVKAADLDEDDGEEDGDVKVASGRGITEVVSGNKKRKRDVKWEKANSRAAEGLAESERYGTARRFEPKSGAGQEELVKPSRQGANAEGESGDSGVQKILPKRNKGPMSNHEAFQALMQGPLPPQEEKKRSKKKRKSRGEMQQKAEEERADEMK